MIRNGNHLTLLENGEAYFPALIDALDAARFEVHLETYIFRADAAGQAVAQALKRAARRGVAARLLLDGFGARGLPRAILMDLRNTGVEVLLFRPELGTFNLRRARLRRMHRKLAVVDARIAFVGGINLIDDLNGLTAPRLDYAVQVEGPLVADIHASARRLWRQVSWSSLGMKRGEDAWLKPKVDLAGDQRAEFRERNALSQRRAIETAYLQAIRSARQEIHIANAYFLPGRRFRHALVEAARNGVRVTLMTQGHTDHPLYRAASRALYRYFLENGIEIYEYRASELHAKVAVVDGRWATVGSSNIDPFSLRLAREANVMAHDPEFAQHLLASLETAQRHDAHRIHRRAWRRIPWTTRLASWLAYGLVRLLAARLGHDPEREGEGADAGGELG